MTSNTSGFTPSRRTLVKGAAWSVPVVAVAGAAPAFASSPPIPPRGMNGWVTLSRQYCSLAIDGRGSFTGGGDNDRGIWTFVDDPAAVIEGGIITFYFDRSDLTWTNGSTGSGWSNLVRDPSRDGASPAPGFFAYTTTYSGTWTYRPEHEAWVANGQPYFTSWMPGSCGAIRSYARRTLTVNDETITFTRGPVEV